jgi:hypothetical protein
MELLHGTGLVWRKVERVHVSELLASTLEEEPVLPRHRQDSGSTDTAGGPIAAIALVRDDTASAPATAPSSAAAATTPGSSSLAPAASAAAPVSSISVVTLATAAAAPAVCAVGLCPGGPAAAPAANLSPGAAATTATATAPAAGLGTATRAEGSAERLAQFAPGTSTATSADASAERLAKWREVSSNYFGVIEVKVPEKLLSFENGSFGAPLDLVAAGWPSDPTSLTPEEKQVSKTVRRIVRQAWTQIFCTGAEFGAICCWWVMR